MVTTYEPAGLFAVRRMHTMDQKGLIGQRGLFTGGIPSVLNPTSATKVYSSSRMSAAVSVLSAGSSTETDILKFTADYRDHPGD